MSDKKHIDLLFQEKFKDFEVSPNPEVWKGIEARLQKKKKRRVIPIWWQLGGVAAALIFLFMIGNSIFSGSTSEEIPTVVNAEEKIEHNNIDSLTNEPVLKQNITVIASEKNKNNSSKHVNDTSKHEEYKTNTSQSLAVSKHSKKYPSKSSISDLNTIKNKDAIASLADKNEPQKNNDDSNQSDSNTRLKLESEIKSLLKTNSNTSEVASLNKIETKNNEDKNLEANQTKEEKGQDIEEAIADANTINEKEEEKLRRWSIAPNVAPVLFNSIGQGSSIDNQFNSNDRSSDITLSVGIKGSYAINKKLKITTGINRVNFNSKTSNIIALSDNSFASSTGDNNLENVALNSSVNDASLLVVSRTSLNNNSVSGAINTIQTGDLNQNFGFIEIPVELEYRVIDKKIGLNLSGGFSTLLLNENEIFADVNGQSTRIGEANNIKNTSFSANIGLGLDYGLTEKININLEPKFKYQINTFNNTSGDFRPFFIGVYTGLSFKF